MDELLLVPRPQRIKMNDGNVNPNSLPVTEISARDLMESRHAEAYRIEVRSDCIRLSAQSSSGMRWAHATLRQLRRHDRIPLMQIDDYPRFANRGLMLDISRDRVPTLPTLFALVDHLAGLKFNHLQLYIEHTLAYVGHEAVWRAASPLTLEELAALDHYCTARGIALTANQNCFGHFERWLRHPQYAALAERSTGMMAHGEFYVPPNTLCPTDPRSLALINDLLRQQLPICSGQYANIGCDEPWDLGLGRSRHACELNGKSAVFSTYVSKVVAMCEALGKRPQFWCDPQPNEDEHLPRNLVALVWGYEASTQFAPRVQTHLQAGREVWVAPGTSCWNSSTARTWNRRANLNAAAAESAANGLLGTLWGDGGHRQQWPVSLFAIADIAMAAWSGPDAFNNRANALHLFQSADAGNWFDSLGNCDAEICQGLTPNFDGSSADSPPVFNASALWLEMHAHLFEPAGRGDRCAWHTVRQRLDQLQSAIPDALDPTSSSECRLALDLAIWAADRALLRRGSPSADARKALAARMADLIAQYRHLWLHRSRYGGLEDSSQHLLQLVRPW